MTDELLPCPCEGDLNYPTHTTECLDRQDSECALYTRAADPRGNDFTKEDAAACEEVRSQREYNREYNRKRREREKKGA